MEELKECRICRGTTLKEVLALGNIFPSAFIDNLTSISLQEKVPLTLVECQHCGLVQLKYTVELDQMYRQYWYSSSLNASMVSSLKDIVDEIERRVPIQREDTIVDIGCNDGTLLGLYTREVANKVGFEPALNIRPKDNNVTTWIPEYFSKEQWDTYHKHPNHPEWANAKAKVVTAIAMFYDLPDPNKFVRDVVSILHEDGVFVIQFTDFLSMIKINAFDNICHEHLEYYKLFDVIKLFKAHRLDVIDVSYNDVNGGSVRVTASHEGRYRIRESVFNSFLREGEYLDRNSFEKLSECVKETIFNLHSFLSSMKSLGKTVTVLGASTKGNTLLQVCGVTRDLVPYAAEINKDKWGLKTIGSNIFIIPETEALALKPDYLLVLPWHFRDNLLARKHIKKYMEEGGKLVFPLPKFEIVGKE